MNPHIEKADQISQVVAGGANQALDASNDIKDRENSEPVDLGNTIESQTIEPESITQLSIGATHEETNGFNSGVSALVEAIDGPAPDNDEPSLSRGQEMGL